MSGLSETDLVVTGDPRFLRAVDRLIDIDEGGFVNDASDRGGATKFGISLRFLATEGRIDRDGDGAADFDLDMDGDIDVADIRALTPDLAISLYRRCFWSRLGCGDLPAPIGEMVFDQAVNGGSVSAVKLLQRAINTCTPGNAIVVDGALGPNTRLRLASVMASPGIEALANAYRSAAKDRYRDIAAHRPSQNRFLRGWLARAERLGRDV